MRNRLLDIRLSLGYKKQIDFANRLNFSRSKYNRFENNTDQPSLEDLFYIARELNMNINDIVYYEEEDLNSEITS